MTGLNCASPPAKSHHQVGSTWGRHRLSAPAGEQEVSMALVDSQVDEEQPRTTTLGGSASDRVFLMAPPVAVAPSTALGYNASSRVSYIKCCSLTTKFKILLVGCRTCA